MRVRSVVNALFVILLTSGGVLAQSVAGTTAGVVRDSSSAASFDAVTDEESGYQISALVRCRSRIQTKLDGLKTDDSEVVPAPGTRCASALKSR